MHLTPRGWCRQAHAEKHAQVCSKHTQGSIHARTEANTAVMYTYISARGRQNQYQTMSTYWPSHTCKDSHTCQYAQADAHAYAHAHTQIHIKLNIHTCILSDTNGHIHKHTHTHPHTHLYTFIKILTQMHTGTHDMFECESTRRDVPKRLQDATGRWL